MAAIAVVTKAVLTEEPKVQTVFLQCSEGRFALKVDPNTSVKEVKKLFKKSSPALFEVNMGAFIANAGGKFLTDENATLKALELPDNTTLFLVKRKNLPFLNTEDREA